MPFWTAASEGQDPKRESRFKVSIESLNDGTNNVWYAKSFGKPSAEVTTTPHKYLNHTFNYPGSVKWSAVELEIIDPTEPIDGAGSIAQLLTAMGYQIPQDGKDLINISKRKGVNSLGYVSVSSINDEGEEIETWNLKQAFVTKFNWGSYKYEGDSLLTLKLTLTYDWAECIIKSPGVEPVTSAKALSQAEATDLSPFFK